VSGASWIIVCGASSAPDGLPPPHDDSSEVSMSKRRFRLPSPALVISMVTLSLVLGGTAVAASTTKHADQKADIKLIKKLAPTLSVKHAKTADSATNATNAINATTAANATKVGGKQVKQFFLNQAKGTASTPVFAIDGITLKAACNSAVNPSLTVENDSGQGGMFAGYSSASALGNISRTNFGGSPVSLTGGANGGGVFTAQLKNGVVVSVQFVGTGTLGGTSTSCYFSGSVIAS
jgi:hypothetical protein